MKLRGKLKGQTIELDRPLELPEGQTVEIEVWTVDDGYPDSALDKDRLNSPAYRTFRPIPAGGRYVSNELVNEIREELGI